MYLKGKTYKIQLIGNIYYTGMIQEEDNSTIRILTIKDEIVIINKTEVRQAILVDSTGDIHDRN
jgi:hypothetical protein